MPARREKEEYDDMRKHVRKVVFAAAALAIAGGVGATIGSAASGKADVAKAGGTYRVGWEAEFGFTDAFDPTGEYLGNAWALYSNLLIRTLVGYNHVAGAAGNKLVPDLAKTMPKVTNGGKTYTFHLKNGVKFAPPVNRAVTSHDIAYAMQRLAKPSYGGQYAFYYTVIQGWDAYAKGKAKSISGIKTPDKSTIVFTLTEPTGDFLYRMAMPATGPIPGEVAKCFQGANSNKYGRNLVSTAGYMFQGSDAVNISSCSAIKPASGYDGQTTMTLVRNPNYSPATDSKSARENLPDSFVFTVNSNADDIYNKIASGDLEDAVASPTPKVLRQYQTDPSLKPRLKVNSGDRTWYLTMNLTQPPFDDVHIRKAMNWIIDKNGLRKGWGGPTAGTIANHIVPDSLLNNAIKSYRPYGTPGDTGSVAKAAAEVKKSKYDPGHTGKCTASACKNVLMIADVRAVDKAMIPVIQANAAKIGITFKVRSVNGAYPVIQTPSKNVPISERPGWGKDYADASTFFNALFASSSILPSGNTNYSLVGITPAMAKKIGAKGNLTGVPSVDADINRCNRTQATPEGVNARIRCWASLDKKLMTQVVPWVPYLSASNINVTGPKVAKWSYDQFSDQTAYAHVAVK
jgi:peptide/nickel transport system substrate-binding protein